MNLDQLGLTVIALLLITMSCVTISTQARLGPIIGFLVAGIILGPNTPGPTLTSNVDQLLDIGELGVVLLMFTVGLEMNVKRLWSMRRLFFGLGNAQIILTGLTIAVALIAITDLSVTSAAVLGFGLSLSSTAIILQVLAERKETNTEHGRGSFAILVMQDLAAVPMLLAVSFLAIPTGASGGTPWYIEAAMAAVSVPILLAVSRWLLPPALTWAADRSSMSSFAIIVIAMVLSAAVLMDLVGLSMAMGAFLVGIMLSASDFRFQVQSTVLPLKGVFMSLFFIAVGMSVDVHFAISNAANILIILLVVAACKVVAMAAAASLFGLSRRAVIKSAFLLVPCGEFGFVLFAAAKAGGVIDDVAFAYSLVIISTSMALTPLAVAAGDRIAKRLAPDAGPEPLPQASGTPEQRVVIAGYSRAGRLLCMLLERVKVPYIAFDYGYAQVLAGRAEGHAVEFGDVANPAMQGAADLAHARMVVVTLEDPHAAQRLAEQLRGFYRDIPIYVAVDDLATRDSLRQDGIAHAVAVSTEGNLMLAAAVLTGVGVEEETVTDLMNDFRKDDYALLRT